MPGLRGEEGEKREYLPVIIGDEHRLALVAVSTSIAGWLVSNLKIHSLLFPPPADFPPLLPRPRVNAAVSLTPLRTVLYRCLAWNTWYSRARPVGRTLRCLHTKYTFPATLMVVHVSSIAVLLSFFLVAIRALLSHTARLLVKPGVHLVRVPILESGRGRTERSAISKRAMEGLLMSVCDGTYMLIHGSCFFLYS